MVLPVDLGSNLSLESISLEDEPINSNGAEQHFFEQTTRQVNVFIHGEPTPFVTELDEVFEAVSLFDNNREMPPAYDIDVTYINGSGQTLPEAQLESLYISEVRNVAVRLLYNSGSESFCSRLSRRPIFSLSNPLCRALSDSLNHFFSHPGNRHRRHIIIFYGDGGGVVQQVLDQTPYADRICVIGIAPTVYVRGNDAHHFRVSGDLTTLFDCDGFTQTNVTTVPYSSGTEGLFFPTIRCPSYLSALCLTATPPPPTEVERNSNQISLVEIGRGGGAFERLSELLRAGDTSAEAEFNFAPTAATDVVLSSIFSIFRINGLLQEIIILSVLPSPDVEVSYVIVCGYSMNLVRYLFLLFTNYRSARDMFRGARLAAHGLTPVIFLVTLLDNINYLRRYGRSPSILTAIFVLASTLSGSVLFMELLRNCWRGLRGRIQQPILRRLTGSSEESRVIIRSQEGNRISSVQMMIGTVHGIFLACIIGVLNGVTINLPSTLGRNSTTDTGVYSNQLHNASVAWRTGDVLAVSQTVSLFICMIVLAVNIMIMVNLVRRNQRR
ncbi:Protein of unknown function (DUF687) [Chlamydia poikilotherma]|uniref:Transmembrane protein n=1 Tax=Chlamydia poikilotherma TaxID=1967783 RepID=A0A3B0Q0T7_9CHLA|nr:DUF687 domain-containing protein [Chlamydia poikilotherma]SYX09175.1 Protein of unknown function (DUF687) [Chlamydia poikilotherma]